MVHPHDLAKGREAYLGDYDEIGPAVFDAGRVEGAGVDGHTRVRRALGEDIAHTRARLEGAQLLHGVGPVRVREQCTREDACAGTEPMSGGTGISDSLSLGEW